MVHGADDHAADQVQRHDDQRGDRIALDELAGAVHGGVKVGLALHARALPARTLRVEQPCVHVGVDRHLFAGHCVKRKARADLGDALRPAGDHDELDRDQDREHDQADDDVAAHDEGAEGRDQRTDAVDLVPARQDEPRRADLEREPEQRRQQQRGREGGKLQRLVDPQRQQQNQRRAQHVQRQKRVEERRRQWNDQNRHDS